MLAVGVFASFHLLRWSVCLAGEQAVMPPGLTSIGHTRELEPQPATRATFAGDWVGLTDDPSTLVVVRFTPESREAYVAVTTLRSGDSTTRVYRLRKFALSGGHLRAGDPSSAFEVEMNVKRGYQTGWGQGWIVERNQSEPSRRMSVQFFYNVGRAASSVLVPEKNGVMVPPTILAGETAWIEELTRIYETARPAREPCQADVSK